MATPAQFRRLATNPHDALRYQMTGRLPQGIKPKSPLIDLLQAIGPRDVERIRGLRLNPRLGYVGPHTFDTAGRALRWLAPSEEVFGAFPAESRRIPTFHKKLFLDDLLDAGAMIPDDLLQKHQHLRDPARLRDEVRHSSESDQAPSTAPDPTPRDFPTPD